LAGPPTTGEGATRDSIPANSEFTTDADLVQSIQSGDPAAGETLHRRYSARLYYLALVRVRSPHDAEDARSETLLRVLSAIRNRELRLPAALASFCLRTLDHVVLEMQRNQRRAGRFPADEPAPSIHEYFLDDGVKAAIERTFARLKPREREFLRMYYYDELPKEEIARRTGITGERVRLLKSRALKSFREMYLRLGNSDTKVHRKSLV
jgi:RNA polymerase sigma factor (sigma-70 family)